MSRRLLMVFSLALAAGLAACGPADRAEVEDAADRAAGAVSAGAGVVDVVAREFAFDAPDSIPSGWTTFRMENAGEQEHFLVLWRLPDGTSFEDYRVEVVDVFGRVWERYTAGEIDREGAGRALGEELPAWFFTGVTPSGGPALTEPGESAQATVRLVPGTYVMECYVKTPDGRFHSEVGMLRQLTVTDESTDASPPDADVRLTLSNYEIASSGELAAGTRTVAVDVQENPEGFLAHDINLFRLEAGADVQEIVDWMDWMDLEQFRAPAPGYSLGGMEHMTAGATGYLTVRLGPGRYAWVSEGYGAQGMVRTFDVE